VEILKPPAAPPFGMDWRTWFDFKKGLAAKKAAVRAKVKRVAKNGINGDEGYAFTESADIYDAVSEIMLDEKLGFDPQVINEMTMRSSSGSPISRVTLQITWTDLETGYFEQEEWIGTGADYGDKGVYKGYTGAAKYALILNFLIPTGGAADPVPGAADPENTDSPKSERRTRQEDAQEKSGTETPENERKAPARRTSSQASKKKDDNDDKATSEKIPPISSEQIGRIKVLIGKLGEFADPQQKKLAIQGTYDALAVKLKMKELSEKQLETLNEGQAAEGITCLEMWLARREKVAHEKAEAEARAAESRKDDNF
jgi:hypothetical protein